MRLAGSLTDTAVLRELGARLERCRIGAGLTQAQLAEQAGISKRSVERIESGHGTDSTLLLRVLRVLGLLEGLELAIPDEPQGPLALLKGRGRARQRVGRPRRTGPGAQASAAGQPWTWRD